MIEDDCKLENTDPDSNQNISQKTRRKHLGDVEYETNLEKE